MYIYHFTTVQSIIICCFKRDNFYHVQIVKPILPHQTFMITTVQFLIAFVSAATRKIKITMKYYNKECKYITSLHSSVRHLPVREQYQLYCSPFCISIGLTTASTSTPAVRLCAFGTESHNAVVEDRHFRDEAIKLTPVLKPAICRRNWLNGYKYKGRCRTH